MNSIGNRCFCYNDDCNQKQWEKEGRPGKRQWTVVEDIYISKQLFPNSKIPKCPWCKKKMTVTANLGYE
jgi:hypothetical protein